MSQSTKRARRATKRSKQAPGLTMWIVGIAMFCTIYGIFAFGVYHLIRDPVDYREAERQHVVDQIEQFREQHGRYPASLSEARIVIVVDDAFHFDDYNTSCDGFSLELRRGRSFPPGERWWTYDSTSKTWTYGSESW